MLVRGERFDCLFGEVGQTRQIDPRGATLRARDEGVAEQGRAGSGADTAEQGQCRRTSGHAVDEKRALGIAAQCLDEGRKIRLRCQTLGPRQRRSRFGAFGPGGVRRQDQRRNLSRRRQRCLHRGGTVEGHLLDALAGTDPVRDRLGEALNVGCQRSVERAVVGRVLADDVDDGCLCAPRVVQIRQAVGKPRPKVQKGAGGSVHHTAVAVRSAGHHTFEQAQHAAHIGFRVQRGHKMHLRGARIREAHVDIAAEQCTHERACTVGLVACACSHWVILG